MKELSRTFCCLISARAKRIKFARRETKVTESVIFQFSTMRVTRIFLECDTNRFAVLLANKL